MSEPKINIFSANDAYKESWSFETIKVLRHDISNYLKSFDSIESLSVLQLEFFIDLLKRLIYVTNKYLRFAYSLKDLNDNYSILMSMVNTAENIDDTYYKLVNKSEGIVAIGELMSLMILCYEIHEERKELLHNKKISTEG